MSYLGGLDQYWDEQKYEDYRLCLICGEPRCWETCRQEETPQADGGADDRRLTAWNDWATDRQAPAGGRA